ncbi:MAG: cyclic pyranopterin monophosphate synthase MoaC [Desulfobacterales bacterium]
MGEFTHIDDQGRVRMVDVSAKAPSHRTAVVQGRIRMQRSTFKLIRDRKMKKGNVLETARIAGIMAAKRTWELIPMCHPLNISYAAVDFFPEETLSAIRIEATVRTVDQTGVEMEALSAVSTAALTIYDMCKSHDRAMVISDIGLLTKSGGKSGTFQRRDPIEGESKTGSAEE